MKKEKDIVDILLDDENKDPIVLVDGNGRKIAFEQIYVSPHNEKLYCILKPTDKIDNVAEDEALVFFVKEEGKDLVLMVETDELIAVEIFEEYYELLGEDIKSERRKL